MTIDLRRTCWRFLTFFLLKYLAFFGLEVVRGTTMEAITVYEAKKELHKYTEKEFLEQLQYLDWATIRQMRTWLFDHEERDNGWLERKAKKLSEAHPPKIRREWYAGRFVYSCKRINRTRTDSQPNHIYHGLGCTEGMIRLWKADPGKKQRLLASTFTGYAVRPEFGIWYASSGKSVDFEFSTQDNFERRLEYKIRKYEPFLRQHPDHLVVFVCDTAEDRIATAIKRYQPTGGGMYLADLHAFLDVPLGLALTAPIYYWEDGQQYPLRS